MVGRTFVSVVVGALAGASALVLAGAAPAQARVEPHVIAAKTVHRVVRAIPLPSRVQPNVKYAGTVSTLQGYSGQAYSTTFDTVSGTFFLLEGEYLYELMANGQTTQITNFFSYGFPNSIIWDSNSQLLYVTDTYELLSVTPQGTISVLAGSTSPGTQDGQGSNARFQSPSGMTIDPVNHYLFVADQDRMRRVDESGNVVTFGPAGSIGTGQYQSSFSLAFDTRTGDIAIADGSQDVVHLFHPSTQTYATIAGVCVQSTQGPGCDALHQDGRGLHALFAYLGGVAYDDKTNAFYMTDFSNYDLRKFDIKGNVTTLAGNGTSAALDGVGLAAEFFGPTCLTVNPVTHTLLLCDQYGSIMRIVTLGGQKPPLPSNYLPLMPTPTLVSAPMGITASPDGSLWFSENASGYVGRLLTTGTMHEFALPGGYSAPYAAASDPQGRVWFGDYTGQGKQGYLARISPGGGISETALPNFCQYGASSASFFTPDALGGLWFADNCPSAVGYRDAHAKIAQFLVPGATGLVLGNGVVWVGEYNQLQEYAFNGVLMATYTNVGPGSGITSSPNGDIWFINDVNGGQVGDFNPATGTAIVYQLPSCGCTRHLGDVTVGADGSVWFTEGPRFGSNYPGGMGKLTSNGTYTEYHTYEPRSQPNGATIDSKGRVWFADFGANKIGYVP